MTASVVDVYQKPSVRAPMHAYKMPRGHVIETKTMDPSIGWIRLSERHVGQDEAWIRVGSGSGVQKVAGRQALDAAITKLFYADLEFLTVAVRKEILRDLTGEVAPPLAVPAFFCGLSLLDGEDGEEGEGEGEEAEEAEEDPSTAAAADEANGDAARREAAEKGSTTKKGGKKGGAAAATALAEAAERHYAKGVRRLAKAAPGQYGPELAARLCGKLAVCCVERGDWWEALFISGSGMLATATRVSPDAPVMRDAMLCHAIASAEVGMLSRARSELQYISLHLDDLFGPAMLQHSAATNPLYFGRLSLNRRIAEVEARYEAVERGEGIKDELKRLGTALADKALGDFALADAKEVARVGGLIAKFCTFPHGRASLKADGMLPEETPEPPRGGDAGIALVGVRATYNHTMYHASTTLGNASSARSRQGLALSRPTDHWEPPHRVVCPGAPRLLAPDQVETLKRERLVVAENALDEGLVRRAAAELEAMQKRGLLWADAQDLCAPRTQRHNLLLHEGTLDAQLRESSPALTACVEALCALPQLLSESLGLQMRVPATVMCTAMPPGASYKEHLDSHGGRDNPRLVTVLLYLSYDPPTGGALRIKTKKGEKLDIFPHPGRVCVFFAQELKHEVMPSEGVRYAMTLWIWQQARDEHGR